MKCPYCAHDVTEVRDSRPTFEDAGIRRRRLCVGCGSRFTTFEVTAETIPGLRLNEAGGMETCGPRNLAEMARLFGDCSGADAALLLSIARRLAVPAVELEAAA